MSDDAFRMTNLESNVTRSRKGRDSIPEVIETPPRRHFPGISCAVKLQFLVFFFSFRNISSCRLLPALPYTFERLLSFPKTLTSSRAHKQSRQPCFVCLPATMLFCWSVSTSSAFLRIDIFLKTTSCGTNTAGAVQKPFASYSC